MVIPDLSLGGIALAPIIVALVEVFKKFGLPTRYAIYANAALSVIGYFVVTYFTATPDNVEWAIAVLKMLVIFLTTAGLYDAGQNAKIFKKTM